MSEHTQNRLDNCLSIISGTIYTHLCLVWHIKTVLCIGHYGDHQLCDAKVIYGLCYIFLPADCFNRKHAYKIMFHCALKNYPIGMG